MEKQKLIERINKLGWGNILYGYDNNGKCININDYNEKDDTFGGYFESFTKDGKPTLIYQYFKFEELPQKLIRA